jgi:uroporphyrin-3 C-methyltransferase
MAENEQPDFLDKLGIWLSPAIILSMLAFVFAVWQWGLTRSEVHSLRNETAQRLTEANKLAQQAQTMSQQATDSTRDMAIRIAELQTRLAESQNQQMALTELYRSMSTHRDEWTLTDIEQLLLTANQQLQLDSNVKAALIALQDADARLQAINRPQFTPLRRALNIDIQRLQSLPPVDTAGMSFRLDNLIARVDQLPLESDPVHPATHRPVARPILPTNRTQAFAQAFWLEVKGLVQVRRLDTPDTALLLPEQSYFLRQNLKLRLLSARIDLSSHDQVDFMTDLQAAKRWINHYFIRDDRATQLALTQIDDLLQTPINIPMPNLDASLAALKASHLPAEP